MGIEPTYYWVAASTYHPVRFRTKRRPSGSDLPSHTDFPKPLTRVPEGRRRINCSAPKASCASGEPENRTRPGVNPYLVSSETASQSLTLQRPDVLPGYTTTPLSAQLGYLVPRYHTGCQDLNLSLPVSSAREDLNLRIHRYQRCALTRLGYGRLILRG